MTRYVVLGAGAVGGTIGGLLARSGHDVLLVARGDHAAAMRAHGLTLGRPDEVIELPVDVAAVDELVLDAADVLLVATKVQDAARLLTQAGVRAGDLDLPIVCAQNGVHGERLALRRFGRVYGVCVIVPAVHLEPGRIDALGWPSPGALDLGRYPRGTDETAAEIAEASCRSGFLATPREDIMAWKYAKLIRNTRNALEALLGGGALGVDDLARRARTEAEAVLAASDIDWVSDADWDAYRGRHVDARAVAGRARGGSSSWQSVQRGLGSIEVDYLNGEIVLLGRLCGVPTPVNGLLQREANALVARGAGPGSVRLEDLLARL